MSNKTRITNTFALIAHPGWLLLLHRWEAVRLFTQVSDNAIALNLATHKAIAPLQQNLGQGDRT
ncbi:hypothetical protein [Altericista sp. CCNU0014]|uniref:hypothetical protein n=1 Tax=Altericista sp. CCNU0014 TaxID=3082949 RepID=UPI00384BC4B6